MGTGPRGGMGTGHGADGSGHGRGAAQKLLWVPAWALPQAPRVPSRRPGCTFTFKNKCDIEKHKSYHIKDDAYAKDGFKKFYKYEECRYEGCVYSKATNHFHCIRAGCGFTFTSTSQMTSHKRKHERRHVRSSGVLGLPSSLLSSKDTEHEESSNDDLVDFSALSSKNSSLSASPTSQQSSASLAAAAAATATATEAVPSTAKPPNSKIPGLLSQGLPASIPLALALSNAGLPTAAPYFPILPGRSSTSLPVGTPGLLGAMSSGAAASAAADTPTLAASGAGDSAPAAATSVPVPPGSIMERISASKGLISPMMARLAAAALKPSATFDPGEQAGLCPGSTWLTDPRSVQNGAGEGWGLARAVFSCARGLCLPRPPSLPALCLLLLICFSGPLALACAPHPGQLCSCICEEEAVEPGLGLVGSFCILGNCSSPAALTPTPPRPRASPRGEQSQSPHVSLGPPLSLLVGTGVQPSGRVATLKGCLRFTPIQPHEARDILLASSCQSVRSDRTFCDHGNVPFCAVHHGRQ